MALHRHKAKNYEREGHISKVSNYNKLQKKIDDHENRCLREVTKGREFNADPFLDGVPKLGGSPKKDSKNRRNNHPEFLTVEELASMQALLNRYGYKLEAKDVSLGIKAIYRESPGMFRGVRVDGETRLVFRHPNPDGSQGGYVEVNCHLHADEKGPNYVEWGSMVLASSVLKASTLRGWSKMTLSKLVSSTLEGRSSLYQLSIVEGSKLAKCTIIESHVINCSLNDCHLLNTPMTMKTHVGKKFVNGVEVLQSLWDAANSREFKNVAPLVELAKAATLWMENIDEDWPVKGGRVPFIRLLF